MNTKRSFYLRPEWYSGYPDLKERPQTKAQTAFYYSTYECSVHAPNSDSNPKCYCPHDGAAVLTVVPTVLIVGVLTALPVQNVPKRVNLQTTLLYVLICSSVVPGRKYTAMIGCTACPFDRF